MLGTTPRFVGKKNIEVKEEEKEDSIVKQQKPAANAVTLGLEKVKEKETPVEWNTVGGSIV
jgi:hypothetical protein